MAQSLSLAQPLSGAGLGGVSNPLHDLAMDIWMEEYTCTHPLQIISIPAPNNAIGDF